jgi:hypothetical protein
MTVSGLCRKRKNSASLDGSKPFGKLEGGKIPGTDRGPAAYLSFIEGV